MEKLQKLFTVFCILLIVTNLIIIFKSYKQAGWDFEVYCSAVKAIDDGKNPYLVRNTSEYTSKDLSFVYPPSSLLLFKPLCLWEHKISYFVFYSVLLLGCFLILSKTTRKKDGLFCSLYFLAASFPHIGIFPQEMWVF